MSDLAVFEFGQSEVRIVGTKDRPEFVVADVCAVLGHTNPTTAIANIPKNAKGLSIVYTPGGPQEMATITEGGLYRLVCRSRKAVARDFESKVFDDILPCIRQHGCYPPPIVEVGNRGLVPFDEQRFAEVLGNAIAAGLTPVQNTLDEHTGRLDRIECTVNKLERRRDIPPAVKRLHIAVIHSKHAGKCPCCKDVLIVHPESGQPLDGLEFEHWVSKTKTKKNETWATCKKCNRRFYSDPDFKANADVFFRAYQQDRRSYENTINPTLPGFGDIVD